MPCVRNHSLVSPFFAVNSLSGQITLTDTRLRRAARATCLGHGAAIARARRDGWDGPRDDELDAVAKGGEKAISFSQRDIEENLAAMNRLLMPVQALA